MVKATITSKGQVTIPKRVRDDLGLVTGDHEGFVADGRGSYKLKPIRTRPSAKGLCDRLVKEGRHASGKDMRRDRPAPGPRRLRAPGRRRPPRSRASPPTRRACLPLAPARSRKAE